jgi:hypothetical protein
MAARVGRNLDAGKCCCSGKLMAMVVKSAAARRAYVRLVDVYECVLIDIIACRYHQELF